jgi:hypothetical protein
MDLLTLGRTSELKPIAAFKPAGGKLGRVAHAARFAVKASCIDGAQMATPKKKKACESWTRKPFKFLVALQGFEPRTCGL